MPVTRAENYWNDPSSTARVSLKRSLHFPFVAIVGSNEIGTYQQKDDVSRVKM